MKHELGLHPLNWTLICRGDVGCCGSILVSHTRGGWVAGSSPFTVKINIFVTEFSDGSVKKFS